MATPPAEFDPELPNTQPDTTPERLTTGPGRVSKRARITAVVAVVVLACAGVAGWRAYLAHTDIVTESELQDAYTASSETGGQAIQDSGSPPSTAVGCTAVKEVLDASRWPNGAVDGRSGSVNGTTGPVSTRNSRYPDQAAASQQVARFAAAVAGCPTLTYTSDPSSDLAGRGPTGQL